MALTPPTSAEKAISARIPTPKLNPPLSRENTTNVIIAYNAPINSPLTSNPSLLTLFNVTTAKNTLSIFMIWSTIEITPVFKSTNFKTKANNNTNKIDAITPIKLAFNMLTKVYILNFFNFNFINPPNRKTYLILRL